MPTVLPQPVRNHPTAQGLARHRATVMLGKLFRRQRLPPRRRAKAGGRAKVGISLAHDRQRQGANLNGEPMVAGPASPLGKQARGPVWLKAAQQTKHRRRGSPISAQASLTRR